MQPLMHIPQGFSLSYESICHIQLGFLRKILPSSQAASLGVNRVKYRENVPYYFFSDTNTLLQTLCIHPTISMVLYRALQLIHNELSQYQSPSHRNVAGKVL